MFAALRCLLVGESLPFPRNCKVGDRVEVRDDHDEDWEEGTVLEMDPVLGPRVRKDGYDGTYFWDHIRPPATPEEAAAWEEQKTKKRKEERRVARMKELGTPEQQAAWREESGDYALADSAMAATLDWSPSVHEGDADLDDVLARLPGEVDEEVARALRTCERVECALLVAAAVAVYDDNGDLGELTDTLQRIVHQLEAEEDALTADGASDREAGEDAKETVASAESMRTVSINSHPSTLLFREVAYLVKSHLGIPMSSSIRDTVEEAADQLDIEFADDTTIRMKLDSIMLELRSAK